MKKQSIKHLIIKYKMNYSKSQKHLIQHYFEYIMKKSLTKRFILHNVKHI
jgi:hypothetical protein